LEFTEWARNNSGKIIDNDKIDIRINRFTSAFDFMFPQKDINALKIKIIERKLSLKKMGMKCQLVN